MELLAFLKLAFYMTNDEKYEKQYLKMINEQHYLTNMSALIDQNPAWFIYYDLTMQAYLFPILIQCENDLKLKSFYQNCMDKWISFRGRPVWAETNGRNAGWSDTPKVFECR